VRKLVAFGASLGIPVQYVCLLDYSNSRGALDMGVAPDLLPGYQPAGEPGLSVDRMLAAADLDVLWVIGADPLATRPLASKPFLVVHEMFLTETAKAADVVFPASSAYEKSGTVTNVCGEVQRLKKGLQQMGTKPDLEIFGLIGKEMGLAPVLGPWIPDTVFQEIRGKVHGYNVPMIEISTGGAAHTAPVNGHIPITVRPEEIRSAHNTLFTSGSLGRYSKILSSVLEGRGPQ
jgi:NADH-quinone oxidoreductase subunit G